MSERVKDIERKRYPVVTTVRELIEKLRGLPPDATVWTGCMPGQNFVEVEPYSAELDIVRIVGPCDGEAP